MRTANYLLLVRAITLLIALTLSTQTNLFSQCLPDGITFSTQEQIDSFQTDYPGCTEILGDVTIEGDDISNLSGLNVIVKINGILYHH